MDGEVADAGKHQILQSLDTDNARAGIDQKDVRLFERELSGSSPETQLAVVPARVSQAELAGFQRAYFFSFAVGPCMGGGRSAILSRS